MKKKIVSLILSTVLALGALAQTGCGSTGTSGTPSNGSGGQTASEGEGTVDLTFWLDNSVHQEYFEAGVNRWNETYPDRQVNVDFEIIPVAQLNSNLLMAFQSGTGAPDLVDINLNHFSNYLVGDIQLAPLNKIVDPVREKFVESRFDIYTKDETVYALPTHVGATVVYYNRPLLEAVGIDIDAIKTWEDFEQAGRDYTKATGKAFTAIETSNQRPFWPMIVQRGGDYTDAEGNVTLDSESNIEVLKQLQKWMHEDKFATTFPSGNTTTEESWAFINDGGIAALIMPMWYMSRFLTAMPDLEGDIYIRPLPRSRETDAYSVGIGGTGTAVTLQSEHVDLAVDLLAFIKLTPEANIALWEYARFDPPRWDVWDSPQLQEPLTYFGNEIVFNTLLEMVDNIPSPNNTLISPAAQDIVMNQVMVRALENKEDARTVLEEAAEELRSRTQ